MGSITEVLRKLLEDAKNTEELDVFEKPIIQELLDDRDGSKQRGL